MMSVFERLVLLALASLVREASIARLLRKVALGNHAPMQQRALLSGHELEEP